MMRTPADLVPNTNAAEGVAVLLDYNVAHIAVLTRRATEGFWITEANYRSCRKTERFITWDDPHLRGFWIPRLSTPLSSDGSMNL